MSESQKYRCIDHMADRVTNLDLDKCAMELVFVDFLKNQQEMRESMAATYHSIISTVKLHGSLLGISPEHFSNKSLTGVGISCVLHLVISKWQYANS